MASAKETKNRIQSIKDTMKITNAMYMIASAKLRKAKAALEQTQPYFDSVRSTMAAIQDMTQKPNHIYVDGCGLHEGPAKRYGYLVMTADKGLSGAYNHNILKLTQHELDKHPGQNLLYVAGRVGRNAFMKQGESVVEGFHYMVQEPSLHRARQVTRRVLRDYQEGQIDELYVVYSRMISPMACEAEVKKLLPLDENTFSDVREMTYSGKYDATELVPSPEAILEGVVPIYLHGMVYGALVESYCSEQNSRMMAMQSATNNAKDMLHDLSVEYNRIRQAAITQEITEVIGGAKAQKNKH